MSVFCGEQIKYNVKFNELIKILAEKRKYRSHWKWLHDQFLFWVQNLNESELFTEDEIETILLLLVPFLCQIFDQHKADNKEPFINLIEKDIQSRYEHISDWQWKYLLNEEINKVTSEIDFSKTQDLKSSQKSPNLEAQSRDMKSSEEYKTFLRKIDYILNLLIPNNFQYAIYKSAFGSNKTFEIKQYFLESPLYFPTQYHKSVIESKKTIAAKARITRTLKKEDDLNVQVGEVEYVVKHVEKSILYKLIIPLNMANEAEVNVIWDEFEDEINAIKSSKNHRTSGKQNHIKHQSK